MAQAGSKGIVDLASNHSFDETVTRVKNILEAKGVTLFAAVDHSGEAEKVGMRMPNTKLLMRGTARLAARKVPINAVTAHVGAGTNSRLIGH